MMRDLFLTPDPVVKRGECICATQQLVAGGLAYRFQVVCQDIAPFPGMYAEGDDLLPAFIIAFQGQFRAYINRCAHVFTQLDWHAGEVFDQAQQHLVCATHYAIFDPLSGRCLEGPCPPGAKLIAIPIEIQGEQIFFGIL